MVDKNFFEVFAAVFGVGHEAMVVWALLFGFPAVFKLVSKLGKEGVLLELV